MEGYSEAVIFLKRHHDILVTIISCLALLVSCLALLGAGISFYWTFLKDRSVLHLVYVDKLVHGMEPQFAIVNGGKSDILITSLSCSFQYIDDTRVTFEPSQTIEWEESKSYLLHSGKAFYCKVKFNEKFTKSFVQKGTLETVHKHELYMHDMYVDISWVEMDGRCFNKSVKFIRYGFGEDCEIKRKAPLHFRKPINLYKLKS